MKSGHRVYPRHGRAFLLSCLAILGSQVCATSSRGTRGLLEAAMPAPVSRFARPLSREPIHALPTQRISWEEALAHRSRVLRVKSGGAPGALAPVPPSTQPQFIDLTTNPRPPQLGPSTVCQEIHPNWAWDQQTILFASNNVDPVSSYGITTPPANARNHIYRMSSDGAFIQQVTGITQAEAGGVQLFPAINHALTKIAFVHRDSPAQPFQLYVLDLFTNQRTQLTGINVLNNPLNANIVNVERPTWSPSDNNIAFAARDVSVTGDVRNIYVVNLVTRVVRRLTNGTPANGVECIDPYYYPLNDGRFPGTLSPRIAFASNTTGINGTTGDLTYVPNPLRDYDGNGQATDLDHNLFHLAENGTNAGAPVMQITTDIADEVEPAFNQSTYPPGNFPPAGSFNGWLAFASRGRLTGIGAQRGLTYDIYFLDFTNGQGNEGPGNAAIRLFTPDTNAGAVPLNQTEERYPSWSAGLPPQNPIDRIAFSSNRRSNINDPLRPLVGPAGDTDIWVAEVTDITPPTLFSFDEQSGETLHIANAPLPNLGRRIGTPGDAFYFYVRLADLQYGIESAWIQIKDPDSDTTDSQGLNHRLYGEGSFPNNTISFLFGELENVYPVRWTSTNSVPTHALHIPWETDFEGIGVSDYVYYAAPIRFDDATIEGNHFGTNSRFPTFNPGVDDSIRWSGNRQSPFNPQTQTNRPPLDSSGNPRWLRIRDDGIFPDLVALDGVYSAAWITPLEPSDYVVDVIAYDKAFDPQNPNNQQNWIIYDNIWGFSTQPFVSRQPVLYVDDNGAGQKWPRGLKGRFRSFPVFRYGTESDIIDRPERLLPHEVRGTGTTVPPPGPYRLVNVQAPVQSAAGLANETFHFLDNSAGSDDFIIWIGAALRRYRYDYWRVLCKGPIPESVLNDYVPTVDQQPGDITGNNIINRPIPRRAVVWSSPYTGDNFIGSGSILDQATQNLLTQYRQRAGRLVVAGGDILWALTVNGSVSSQFAANVLGARFASDEGGANNGNWRARITTSGLVDDITLDAAGRNFVENAPPGTPYYDPFWDPDPLGTLTSWPSWSTNFHQGDGNVDWTSATDGTPFRTPENINSVDANINVMAYDQRMLVTDDSAGSTGSKTVFMAFSLASIGRRYTSNDDDDPLDCMNYRAKISHAMFCWMFSADLVGQVRNLNGGGPISGAWVQAYQGGTLVGAAFSRPDGTYTIRGLPVGAWTIQVDNPGFLSFNKATGSGAHGLAQSTLDVLLTPAAPGSISGRVLDQFNQPVPGTVILATLQASPLFTGQRDYFATTGADGRYVIPSAPTGNYDVSISQLPPGFGNPVANFNNPITVLPAQDTPNIDFTVEGLSGTLQVSVREQLPDGTRGAPVEAADVTLLDQNGAVLGSSQLTDAGGLTTFTAVPPGPITVTVFKTGYQEATANVNVPQVTQVEILLPRAPQRQLYGMVRREVTGTPVDSADLNPPVTLQILRRASQLPIGVATNVFAPPSVTPVLHNYAFLAAQEGTFTVALQGHPRFLDTSVNVDITSAGNNIAPDLTLLGRPGILSGTVRENNGGAGGAPIVGALVEAVSEAVSPGSVIASGVTAVDGTFALGSLGSPVPSDVYTVRIRKFGFSQRDVTSVFLAGNTDIGTVLLDKSGRGRIFGLVGRSTGGNPPTVNVPRDGVVVEFYTPASSPFGLNLVTQATSFLPTQPGPGGRQFNYTAGDANPLAEFLPEGVYEVRVTDPRFVPFSGGVTVIANQERPFDIVLQPLPGILSGTVRENLGGGQAGPVVPGATVRITNRNTGAQVGPTLVTDTAGQYQTAGALQPAAYVITVTKFGFLQAAIEVFVEGDTTAPNILLTKLPPTNVSGRVVSALDNTVFISGATVQIFAPTDTNTPLASGITNANTTGSNFALAGVSPGNYLIRATKPGWQPSSFRAITVNPGVDTTNVVITLNPDHTFGRGLLLIGLPDDYPGIDAAALFDRTSAEFRSAYWRTAQTNYAIYPEPEAAEFRLGKGIFVRFANPTAFAKTGVPAPNAPFAIPLGSGWNMIGSVRRTRIEWLRVRVATPDGATRSMQQAMDAGILQAGLFAYQDRYVLSDFMDPFAGYFVRAFQDCTLLVPVNNSASILTPQERRLAARHRPPAVEQVGRELAMAGIGPRPTGGDAPRFVGERARTARADWGWTAPVRWFLELVGRTLLGATLAPPVGQSD